MLPSAISRTSAAVVVARHAGRSRRSAMLNVGRKQARDNAARTMASSPFPDLPLPDSIRDAVKSSVLEEASKPNSSFWRGEEQRHRSAAEEGDSSHEGSRRSSSGRHARHANGTNIDVQRATINDPIAQDRQHATLASSDSKTLPTAATLDPHPLIHFDPWTNGTSIAARRCHCIPCRMGYGPWQMVLIPLFCPRPTSTRSVPA